jgi:hypothetical protein
VELGEWVLVLQSNITAFTSVLGCDIVQLGEWFLVLQSNITAFILKGQGKTDRTIASK